MNLYSSKDRAAVLNQVCVFVFHGAKPDVVAKVVDLNFDDPNHPEHRLDFENYEHVAVEDPYELYRTAQGIAPVPYLVYAKPDQLIEEEDGRIRRRFKVEWFVNADIYLAHSQLAEEFERGFASSNAPVAGPSKRIVTPGDLRLSQ